MPNKRRLDMLLAEHLRGLADGSVIVHPPVQVLSQWVAQTLRQMLWLSGKAAPRAVDPQHHLQCWQQSWPDRESHLSETEKQLAARQAMTADRLLRQWYPADGKAWLDPHFFSARQAVEQARQSGGWCTADEQTAQLCDVLGSDADLPVRLPEEIRLAGFHEWTLLESRLWAALEQRGVTLHGFPHAEPPLSPDDTAELQSFANPDDELQAAAEWAADQLREARFDATSEPIAVVIHGLDRSPEHARRVFERCLPSRHNVDGINPASPDFYLPYGPPLTQHAAVQDVLMLLRLGESGARKPIAFPTLSRLLLSPHWGTTATEQFARASLELKLRRDGAYQLSLSSLFDAARRSKLDLVLEDSLARIRAALAVDWAHQDALENSVRAWGWPGSQSAGPVLNSLLSRFRALLERARNLDGLSPGQRMQALQQMCSSESQDGIGGPLAPVQLLTPEDAVGQRFAAAWVVGLNAGNWPGQPVSSPFLPGEVTRHIPRASAEGELQWCERITAGLSNLAPRVIFSWARQAEDLPQAPSPLLSDLPQPENGEMPAEVAASGLWRSYADHPWLSELPDRQGLALANEEPIHGGAATLSTQSANPLAAYLKYRLNARFDSMPEPFADAAWRGSLLHRALQALYQPLLGQAELPVDENIPGAVETALQSLHAFTRLTPIQYRAEQLRLQRVLQDWLETERSRPPFQVIALEQELETRLLGHPIQLRLDRADQLEPDDNAVSDEAVEKAVLIIDYKSGKSDLGPWSRERLGEVQLPLYACSWQGPGTVAGLALARVKYGDIDIQGVVANPDEAFGRVKTFGKSGAAVHKRFTDWPEALQSWRESIEQIAGEYIRGESGNTTYDPKNYSIAELAPLLRLEEGTEWLQQHGVAVNSGTDEDSDEEVGSDQGAAA